MSTKILTRPGNFTSLVNDLFNPWNEWFDDRKFSNTLTVPKVNITEDKDKYNVSIAAPGLNKDDFYVNVANDVLTISAQRETNKETKEEKWHKEEYNFSSFSRSFSIPADVLQEKIDAAYDSGILSIMLPKKVVAEQKPDKSIPVK